jgi:hypothetical protein
MKSINQIKTVEFFYIVLIKFNNIQTLSINIGHEQGRDKIPGGTQLFLFTP